MNEHRRPDPMRVREFAVTARRLASERQRASGIVEPLLRKIPQVEWPSLVDHVELQTVGAIEQLGNVVGHMVTKQPLAAKALAELALALAESIEPGSYPAVIITQTQAHAWKDLGKAHRYLGRNQEALRFFQIAEDKLGQCSLAHDRAVIRFNLAVSLQEMERFDESQALLTESRGVFRAHGDTRNEVLCAFVEGVLLQRTNRFRDAREMYLLLLASTRELDTETRACLHQTIGLCSIELGAFVDADTNLTHAIHLYRQIGQPVPILQVELGRGRLLIRTREAAKAVAHLLPVRREFLRHGMHEEAGISGLELVEAYLLLDRASQAESLAKKIVGEFTLAELNHRAITALSYLTEAIVARKAQPSLVSQVREYILSLQWQPEREFHPA